MTTRFRKLPDIALICLSVSLNSIAADQSFSFYSDILYRVYTTQPVLQPVVQPVGQPVNFNASVINLRHSTSQPVSMV